MKPGDRVCFCRSGLCGKIIMAASGILSPSCTVDGDDGSFYTVYGDDGIFYTARNGDIMAISDDRDQGQGSTNDQRSI